MSPEEITSKEIENTLTQIEMLQRRLDVKSLRLAKMLRGRLRKIPDDYEGRKVLRDLKRELSDYNASTGCWKT
ncbi:MAG: hypothetical protein AAGI44_18265 [Pseudomonadota bacterium]